MVTLALPDPAAVTVTFTDDGQVRDITALVPDLVLLGLLASSGRVPGEGDLLAAADQVDVGAVDLVGAAADEVTVAYWHTPSGEGTAGTWLQAVPLLTAGIVEQLTAGVAAEASQVPDAPSG